MLLIVQMNSHLLKKHSALKFWDESAGAAVIGVVGVTGTIIMIIIVLGDFIFEVREG